MIVQNEDLVPLLPSWIRNSDGSAEKVDDYTVKFIYDRPATLFLSEIANQDGPDRAFSAGALSEEVPPQLHVQGGTGSSDASCELQVME
jgi:hypothetical protein